MTAELPRHLQDLLAELDSDDSALLVAAYEFAQSAHRDHVRPTGEPYLDHGIVVAKEVADLGIDDIDTLRAAVLHDVVLDHAQCPDKELAKRFGQDVLSLVRGTHNLDEYANRATRGKTSERLGLEVIGDSETLEAIRRALLSIIEGDIRIILIRMADCLQDLRRANRLKPTQQRELAYQAMHIYAPLANRLGIWHLKWQLEDQAFRYLDPEKFREIARNLDTMREQRATKIDRAAARLRRRLDEMGLQATITGRSKHVYSIYRKMQRKQLDFDQLHDIQALRVILQPRDPAVYEQLNNKAKEDEDRALCYQVLGAVHALWEPIPREFDDYIGTPKANGYQSLHTAVIDVESGQKLEIQIRTQRMHEEAERGVAAHWAYKEQGTHVSASAQRRLSNLRELLANLQDVEAGTEDTGLLSDEKGDERVYVFTPNDDVVDLPAGSTPIDFAYQIHTQVGHRCRGARINGKMVSLDYTLRPGDKVEIVTANRGGPNRAWMNPSLGYTGNPRTRSKIRQWFREQEREQNIAQGRDAVERELKRLGFADIHSVDDIALQLRYDDVDDFLAKVGFGDIQTVQITGAIAALHREYDSNDDDMSSLLNPLPSRSKGLTVRGVGGLHTRLAGCCHPISPEPIIGYVTRGQGVTIHRRDCREIEAINEPERLIEVDWGTESRTHPVPVMLKAYKRSGLVEEIVNVLRGQQIGVPRTKLISDDTTMTVYLVAEVTSLVQLTWLLTKLENLPNVIEARRQRWS